MAGSYAVGIPAVTRLRGTNDVGTQLEHMAGDPLQGSPAGRRR